ncbi:MAG: hypothetical protein K1X35_06910 [Caulobacteraceae bacterium]|nr:hypothetical protein [Caulobacteraceae bacterium]
MAQRKVFRTVGAATAAALFMAGCGGGTTAPQKGEGPPGAQPVDDWKGKMGDLMTPCQDALKDTDKSVGQIRAGRATLNEIKLRADETVAVCEKALADWTALRMPTEAAEPCLQQATLMRDQAYALRQGLDHSMSKTYQARADRLEEDAKKAADACKKAKNK